MHPLARAQHSAAHDVAHDVAVVDAVDPQHDRAVGEEDIVARPDPARELRQRGRDAVRVTDDGGRREDESIARIELHFVVGDGTGPHLRSGQVDQHSDRSPELGCDFASGARVLGVNAGVGVRSIQTNDVGAGLEQRAHRLRPRRRGADGRYDLRAPHSPGLSRGAGDG